MKLLKKILTVLIMILGVCIYISANAETITGSAVETVTFNVHVNYSNGYIVLASATGNARVACGTWYGGYTGEYKNEKHHGFYKVTAIGEGYTNSMIWAPSATTNKSKISTCDEVTLTFPCAGDFTITVEPVSEMSYWKVEYIDRWITPAQWMVTNPYGCKVTKQEKLVDKGTVLVKMYYDGSVRRTYSVNITGNQYVYSEKMDGYTCNAEREYVMFDNRTGKCSPSEITFIYERKQTSTPRPMVTASSNSNTERSAKIYIFCYGTDGALLDSRSEQRNPGRHTIYPYFGELYHNGKKYYAEQKQYDLVVYSDGSANQTEFIFYYTPEENASIPATNTPRSEKKNLDQTAVICKSPIYPRPGPGTGKNTYNYEVLGQTVTVHSRARSGDKWWICFSGDLRCEGKVFNLDHMWISETYLDENSYNLYALPEE